MRLSKAWTVASKDFKTFRNKRSILYSILLFEAAVSIGMPFILRYVAGRPDGAVVLPIIMNAFSFWFVIGATLMPVGVASYSLIGEKVQKSLEPLLATPTTDEEILAGKTIAAFLPAICANCIGAVIFTVLVDVFTHSTLNYLYYPKWRHLWPPLMWPSSSWSRQPSGGKKSSQNGSETSGRGFHAVASTVKATQRGVHLTGGILRDLQAFSTRQVLHRRWRACLPAMERLPAGDGEVVYRRWASCLSAMDKLSIGDRRDGWR